MSDDVKMTAIIVLGVLLLMGGIFASCNYQAALDAHAPIVESCIKHPSTRSPLVGGGVR